MTEGPYESDPQRWADRVLVALAARDRGAREQAVLRAVAVRFADRFHPLDREYQGGRPYWHQRTLDALGALRDDGLLREDDGWRVTDAGRAAVPAAQARLAEDPEPPHAAPVPTVEPGAGDDTDLPGPGPSASLVAGVITPPLRSRRDRRRSALATEDDESMPVMIELNLTYRSGVTGAFRALRDLWEEVTGDRDVTRLAEEYATGTLSMNQVKRLVAADAVPIFWPDRAVKRVWPDFQVRRQIDASAVTVKADAAQRSFRADGAGIVWAVVDSGIDATHPHFAAYHTLDDPAVADLHRSFTAGPEPTPDGALVDEDGHGTHVAAIIAGGLREWDGDESRVYVTTSAYNVDNPREPLRAPRHVADAKQALAGMAPRARLVSLKVLGGGGPLESRVSRVIAALAYVREVNAGSQKVQRIHGVNLSLGYDFDPTWFACGASPLCQEVDKLVRTGVLVVVAAGNSGFGTLNPLLSTVSQFGLPMTINDPGNAARALTVGSTHRDAPHAYGVSYFSSKGPTGDGRQKPDLVAPGERIASAAAGQLRAAVSVPAELVDPAVYVEESGTSMAAPHVSGVAAAFLSVRREFLGRPDEVKEILTASATPLGRDRAFEGAGLVDLMRALQSV